MAFGAALRGGLSTGIGLASAFTLAARRENTLAASLAAERACRRALDFFACFACVRTAFRGVAFRRLARTCLRDVRNFACAAFRVRALRLLEALAVDFFAFFIGTCAPVLPRLHRGAAHLIKNRLLESGAYALERNTLHYGIKESLYDESRGLGFGNAA